MSRSEKKEHTRLRIVEAAAQGFRSSGYGLGVDGLARRAGVTSGAFYVHFSSKADAFREAVRHGMDDLKAGIEYFQHEHGATWWPEFVRFYLGTKRTCDLADSCSLQSLTPELARADDAARELFEDRFTAVAQAIVNGPPSPHKPASLEAARAALASLVGGVTLARAVGGREMADRIAESVERALLGEDRSGA